MKLKNSAMRKANSIEESFETGSDDSELVEDSRKPTIEVDETPR